MLSWSILKLTILLLLRLLTPPIWHHWTMWGVPRCFEIFEILTSVKIWEMRNMAEVSTFQVRERLLSTGGQNVSSSQTTKWAQFKFRRLPIPISAPQCEIHLRWGFSIFFNPYISWGNSVSFQTCCLAGQPGRPRHLLLLARPHPLLWAQLPKDIQDQEILSCQVNICISCKSLISLIQTRIGSSDRSQCGDGCDATMDYSQVLFQIRFWKFWLNINQVLSPQIFCSVVNSLKSFATMDPGHASERLLKLALCVFFILFISSPYFHTSYLIFVTGATGGSTLLYPVSLIFGCWEDQHRNPNINNKDHLVGQLTVQAVPV